MRRGAQLAVRCPGPSGSARCSKKRGRNRCGAFYRALSKCCLERSSSVFRWTANQVRPPATGPRHYPRTRLEWTRPALHASLRRMALSARRDERTAHADQNKVPSNRCPSFGRAFARVFRWRGQGRAVQHSNWGRPRCRRARREKIASTPAPRSPALSCVANTSVASCPSS